MPVIEHSSAILMVWAIIGYLLGSVPFGMVITRAMNLGNLREIGSGNIGATNVLRTGNKGAALATLLLDGAKGAVAVLIARLLAGDDAAQIAGLAAFVGHCWPVWLGFRGGKGVATFLGLMLALAWPVGLACCATWAAAFAATRISSAGALTAAASTALWVLILGPFRIFVLALILTGLVFLRHSANIVRLRAGTEPKVGQKKTPES
ncbi:glycerol-3-phosphate 1-O-acyltransferase PlsY [Primorskyibacter flagellatus]|uniref:Glycerol-3-phosphate acyltransferase n=1 Tax=Primorskyibacter flagellatus TaxID=1387277 RepID=A0A1W2AXA0_9RHOB|nr:glycerol-3-phosphate 1-O-acyltransferase PlsY [Primorskyibacter flagellatus]SMC65244.1 acyl-phosphate glycerol-3-phosphate acyltransferase [Primorskyibacter flagellatus]